MGFRQDVERHGKDKDDDDTCVDKVLPDKVVEDEDQEAPMMKMELMDQETLMKMQLTGRGQTWMESQEQVTPHRQILTLRVM